MSRGMSLDLLTISYVTPCALTIRLLLIALLQRKTDSGRKTPFDVYGFVYGEEPLTPNRV